MNAASAPAPTMAAAPTTEVVERAAFTRAARPRRVLVYAPLAYSTPHFETDLEIAQRHLDLGDEVELVLCDAELPSCQLNPRREAARCVQCVSRNLQGAAQLSAPVPVLDLLGALKAEDRAVLAAIPREFRDQAELRGYHCAGFDAGMATLSSVIDFARTPMVDTRAHAGVIRATLVAAVGTFLALRRRLAAGRHDRVYIYNGRWSMVRSAVRACEQTGVEFYTHERGSDFRKFALHHQALPHDMAGFRARVRAAWAARGPEAAAEAEAFFAGRRQRVEAAWFSFVKGQEAGRVPADWGRTARRLVWFTSSEFESAAIGEGTTGRIYPGQTAAAPRIARLLAEHGPAAHLWVRVHPNDRSAETTRRWTAATAGLRNVTLVLPEAPVDSYALLDGAERVLTFGSTTGIEATFWGKPAVCADFSFFDGLEAHHEATTEAELLELLTRRELPAKPREGALACGYYLRTFGAEFAHFATEKISDYAFESPFRGRCLKPDYDDLRRRMVALAEAGEWRRAGAVARLVCDFRPADDAAQTVRAVAGLREGAVAEALAGLEAAAQVLTAEQLERVLQQTGKALLEATLRLGQAGRSAEFAREARRAGALLGRVPKLAEIGGKLLAMAARATASGGPGRTAARGDAGPPARVGRTGQTTDYGPQTTNDGGGAWASRPPR